MTSVPRESIRVLCVDDVASSDHIATHLERESDRIDTITATSANDAVDDLDDADCIVSEYDLPGTDGIEFLRAVRELGSELPFVLFTSEGSEAVASEAISAGVSDYVERTGQADQYTDLARRIDNLVRHERADTQLERGGDTAAAESTVGTRGQFRGSDSDEVPTGIADETPAEPREAFDALAEASADGIIMLDDTSTIRYANPAVERILGYTREELVGSPKMKIIPERLREAHAQAFYRYIRTDDKHIDWTYVELPGRHKDGYEIPLAISLNDFEHHGERYFVGTFRDISKRKQVERELKRQNERLDQFAGIVSHDLQSPLNVVRGYLELLEDDYEDERIGKALAAATRIESIIEDTLALAREGEIVDAEAVAEISLADYVERCWRTIDVGAATLELETDLRLRADPERLRHIFENLFVNAVEHGSAGNRGVAQGESSDEDQVTIRVGDLPDGDGFYVEDDGAGFDGSDYSSVFDAGYTTSEDGSGFGLSIVQRVAGAHGWDVRATEGSDGGARFEFSGVSRSEMKFENRK